MQKTVLLLSTLCYFNKNVLASKYVRTQDRSIQFLDIGNGSGLRGSHESLATTTRTVITQRIERELQINVGSINYENLANERFNDAGTVKAESGVESLVRETPGKQALSTGAKVNAGKTGSYIGLVSSETAGRERPNELGIWSAGSDVGLIQRETPGKEAPEELLEKQREKVQSFDPSLTLESNIGISGNVPPLTGAKSDVEAGSYDALFHSKTVDNERPNELGIAAAGSDVGLLKPETPGKEAPKEKLEERQEQTQNQKQSIYMTTGSEIVALGRKTPREESSPIGAKPNTWGTGMDVGLISSETRGIERPNEIGIAAAGSDIGLIDWSIPGNQAPVKLSEQRQEQTQKSNMFLSFPMCLGYILTAVATILFLIKRNSNKPRGSKNEDALNDKPLNNLYSHRAPYEDEYEISL